jgi:NAD(P)-dependent dehydrogenase (short-subunit alcohol dehydrogenase family)
LEPSLDIFSLSGRSALVAGASRGIGLAIARALAGAGAHTILAARSLAPLERAAAELRKQGRSAEAIALDVTDAESIRAAADAAGAPDILINVAGTNLRKPFVDYTPEEYDRLMTTNLHGLVALTQAVGAKMIARGKGGKVISIGSLATVIGYPYVSVYAMTKGALGQLTKALAAEWGPHNIQVNCIAPGFILTDLTREMWKAPEMHAWLQGAQANPTTGTPEDVAALALFLAGRGADYITGQVIAVDGGFTTTSVWPYRPQ